MNKRLAFLQQMVGQGKADAFARYALAMEYRKDGELEKAIETFEALRDAESGYLPMYLMAGQLLVESDRAAAAREWLEQGVVLAKSQGDSKAECELHALLEQLR